MPGVPAATARGLTNFSAYESFSQRRLIQLAKVAKAASRFSKSPAENGVSIFRSCVTLLSDSAYGGTSRTLEGSRCNFS